MPAETIEAPATETVVAAPVNTPDTTAAPSAAAAPEKPRLADPFANLTLPPKKETPAAPAKPGEKAAPATTTTKPEGGKTMATRKDPIAEQRTRIEQQNTTIATTTKERDELRREVDRLRQSGDTTALMASIQELKKKNEQLTGEISARDFSKSPDFQTKYEKPFNDAANHGKKIIESLQVTDGEGNARAADWKKDFAPIFSLPRPAARARAKEMFGEDAGDVMAQYDKLHELQESKEQALTEWQTGATERDQKQRAETLVRQQNISQAFELVTKNFMESDPEFQEKPDDAERTELWKKSQAIVDKAYMERDKFAPHELILLDAAIRLRAINEPVLRAKLVKLTEERDELLARLGEKETSASGSTRKKAAAPAAPVDEDWKKELMGKLKEAS
jgi:hypothetical protein